ncbi:MAG: hypothetical protein NWS46_07535, partial [Cyclobacteriaceae bacterium]|nr:hypothetical protein [Cyclobacteriaceae bacterium]
MTGYGIVLTENETHTFQAELKTLNSKFTDIFCRMPRT